MQNLTRIIHNDILTNYHVDIIGNVYRENKQGIIKEKALAFKTCNGRGKYVGLRINQKQYSVSIAQLLKQINAKEANSKRINIKSESVSTV